MTPSEGGRRPAGRGGRVARRRVGGNFKGPDVLRTSHEQRRAHPRLCASAGEMQAPRRPRPPRLTGARARSLSLWPSFGWRIMSFCFAAPSGSDVTGLSSVSNQTFLLL